MQKYETLDVTQAGEIVTVALNRPKLNLFNERMMRELAHAFSSQRENTTARFIILTARGEHFSGGIDLKEINDRGFTAQDARMNQLLGHDLMKSIENVEQVTLAALHGLVCGAGMAVAQAWSAGGLEWWNIGMLGFRSRGSDCPRQIVKN